jgi:trimeric autotransporter adhesin
MRRTFIVGVSSALLFGVEALAQCPPTWSSSALPGTNGIVHAFGWFDPDGVAPLPIRRVVGGAFSSIGGVAANNIAMQDPVSGAWLPMGSGVNGAVFAMTTDIDGNLWVGGYFTSAGGGPFPAGGLARWNGSWQSSYGGVAGSLGGGPTVIAALTLDGSGNLIVGGNFATVGGISSPVVAAPYIARMDVSSLAWSPIGGGVGGDLFALIHRPNGNLVAGGMFGIREWNGSSWTQPGGGLGGWVHALANLPNGDLVAGGQFNVGSSAWIGRLSGGVWSGFGTGLAGNVLALLPLPDGQLIVGGEFYLAGGAAANRIARWTGSAWTTLGAGVAGLLPNGPRVSALQLLPSSQIAVGGYFTSAGTQPIANLAEWGGCPALSMPFGIGCVGAGGFQLLTAIDPPWLGGTATLRASGMPANSIAVSVRGLGTLAQPLASILPQGLPGCSLLVTPDLLDLALPGSGQVIVAIPIPAAAGLLGATFHQQVVAVELDAGGAISSVSSTNGMSLTIGGW